MENVFDQKAISSESKCSSRREWFPNKTSLVKKKRKKKKKKPNHPNTCFPQKTSILRRLKACGKKYLCEAFCKDYSLQTHLAALSALSPNAIEYNYVKSISKAT